MWTYLVILFSIIVLVAVFVHRLIILKRGGARKNNSDEEEIGQDEMPIKKGRLSKSDNSKAVALSKRGEVLIAAGKDDEAIKCFVQALAIDSAHVETLNKLAMLYLQKQMFSAAAALFKQLGELTQDAVHLSHLGLALYQQSDFEGAKLAYQKAVDLDPSRPQRFISLAQVYRALGQPNNAIVAVRKAVEMDEKNPEFLYLLADLQLEAGIIEEAKIVLTDLLTLDPQNKEFKALMKEIKKMGKSARADGDGPGLV